MIELLYISSLSSDHARISLTLSHTLSLSLSLSLSRDSFQSSIASGRSSRQHPMSVQNCYRYVQADRTKPARPCKGVRRRRSLMSSPLLLQQCAACIVRFIWMVPEMVQVGSRTAAVLGTLVPEFVQHIYIYIYSHPQTDLIRSIRTHQCG